MKEQEKTYNYNFSKYYVCCDGEEGKIYSTIRGKFLNPKINKNGYKQVTVINDDGEHITMNYARFLLIKEDPRESYKGLVVDHINRDKNDDRLCNLRWTTAQSNSYNRENKNRPHRDIPIILEYENGQIMTYTYKNRHLFDIPYITVYTLANNKEGKNSSKKWGIKKAYYKY